MMFGLGVGELVVIFLVVFILFGPKALPDIARQLGKAINSFKKQTSDYSSLDHTNDFHDTLERRDWRSEVNKEEVKKT